ncbi:MAG: hypothetical protein RI983_1903 [Bacteroidota bacterium]|jgi:predicted acylesterase/phospholipase RssA
MQNEAFQLGLCMAGAVSAGAYTAGVLDCLLEALEGWEQKRGQEGVPTHRVTISVVGGASAGGMTGLLTAAAIQQPSEKIFYKSWVEMEADSMAGTMLDPSDIIASQSLSSLLNGSFVERLSHWAIETALQPSPVLPAYIDPSLKLFATLTNLKGYPYNISFTSALQKKAHRMMVHNDFACFQLAGSRLPNMEQQERETQLQADPGWIPLNLSAGKNTDILQQAIMATGAFPLVLKPVQLKRANRMILENDWLNQNGLLLDTQSEDYFSLQVDGGLMNNEPFEKVRELLQEKNAGAATAPYRDSFSSFTNTVLMIDPFPDTLSFQENDSLHFRGIAKQILFAILHQMKAKPLPIADMMNKEKAGQFLIAPVRYAKNTEERIEGSKAIASGVAGGFGGFLSKSFRAHDYALGQYNCARFLQNHFTVPINRLHQHPLFSKGYAGIDVQPFLSENKDSVQIIPVFQLPKKAPEWPVIHSQSIDALHPAIRRRTAAILSVMSRHWFRKRLLQLSGQFLINRYTANSIIRHLKSELTAHSLLQ